VQGFYSPPRDEIVVISEDGERTVDNATLIHELTHALQDQYHNLSRPKYAGQTQDGDLAATGIVEGIASYVETRYAQKCAGEWDCVTPAADGGGGGDLPNYGLYLVVFQPYSDGPAFVDALHGGGDWGAVNQSMQHPPNSTEQIIHVTNETPVSVTLNNTATAGWQPFPDQGVDGADTLGEASIYAMFWYQTRNYDAGIVSLRDFATADGPFDRYDYDATPSAGWAGDRVVPYRQSVGPNETRYGYVWATEWDTRADARQFAEAYRTMLRAHGANQLGPETYRIPDGSYADAFHVSRNGTRVTIVNGPQVDDLSEIRPGIEVKETTTRETTAATTERGVPNATTAETDTTTSDGISGFGIAVALVAILALAALAAIRRRSGGD
jgi:PGF-CTERM protein